jgi:hypothetical protein
MSWKSLRASRSLPRGKEVCVTVAFSTDERDFAWR